MERTWKRERRRSSGDESHGRRIGGRNDKIHEQGDEKEGGGSGVLPCEETPSDSRHGWLEREGGDWGQLLQLRADWGSEEVRRQMRAEVEDQWAFVVDFGQLTGIAHAHAVESLYSKGERGLGNLIGAKIMERVMDVTHLGWSGQNGEGYGKVRVEGHGAHGDWVGGHYLWQ